MRKKGRKNFFFEKKKQKTLWFLDTFLGAVRLKSKSFLVLFFKKERASFFTREPHS
jgi:hypothetical protein